MSKYFFLFLLFPFFAFALEIQSDTKNAFIFTDNVEYFNTLPCKNGNIFLPENSSFFGEENSPGLPFRTYIIALPNSMPPSVNLENLKSENINGKPCGAEQNPLSLKVGEPYLKDNLWRVKINVPLVYSNGNSWNLRKNFRLRINFNGNSNGFSVGKRALSLVENKNSAAKFGTKQIQISSSSKKLSKDLNTNDWLLKISIGNTDLSETADGMYAVSFDELKSTMQTAGKGSDIDGISVSNLRLFGASPDTLAEFIGDEIFPNAVEIPIIVKDKNNNGIFDSGDSIAFFGYGTKLWKKSGSASGMDYYFSNSPYNFYQNFYLGAAASGTGKKLENTKKNISSSKDIAWKKYVRSEKDLLLRDNYFGSSSIEENTGKEWFWAWGLVGETVTVNSSEFQNSVRNLTNLQGNSIFIGVSFFPKRSYRYSETLSRNPWKERMRGINFNFYFQNSQLQNSNIIDTIFGGTFVFEATNANSSNNSYRLDIKSETSNDRFDGLSVAYNYDVAKSNGNEWLFPGTANGAVKIPVPANMELVKTENHIPVEIIEAENNYANDTISNSGDTKYFLQRKNSYKKPNSIEAIPNRISSVSNPLNIPANTEYLILTSEVLQNSAAKLKQFREGRDIIKSLNTEIVLIEDIYRLHGAHGSPVAIRDYIRYAKDRCQNLEYVLLAGSGHYDYRNIKSNSKNNFLLPYEIEDISTDDFFAVLDPGYGIRFGDYELSLAVGRLPVSNASEFENYIEKVTEYEKISVMDNGIWRNTIIFNADDQLQGTTIDNIWHTEQMERTITKVDTLAQKQNFAIDWRKISLLQYEKDGSGKKPEATKELLRRLNQGALFTFYYGHGNSVQWADEDLLNVSSLNNVSNRAKYTILGSFSCLVARFDDAVTTSLSEAFVNAKSKGAIAAIGSLRDSYSNWNEAIATEILTQSLFAPNNKNFLGDAFLRTKQSASFSYNSQRYNNEKYVLLGEPVLSMPKQEIELELNNAPDTIQALQKLNLSGKASVQTGLVNMQILEGEKYRTLTQNLSDGTVYTSGIKVDGNPIYSEELQIKNGEFSTEFVTPRKLSLGDSSAQIRLWGYKPGTAGIGKTLKNNISLFGTSSYADSIKDNTPPSIKIYPCMRSGVATPYAENAHVSLEIPACLSVVIEDSTGIDYREEADEGIFFELSPISSSWHPWSFSERTGKKAVTEVDFGNSYDPGEYVFRVNAQDILGNTAFRSLRISLNQENKAGLADVFNVPNPMKKNGTTFYFKDLSGDRQSSVRIKIFNQNGKLVKTINNAISGVTHWDGRDSRGRLLANGLYHYVVQNTVQPLSETGSKKNFEKKQKLIISR